MLFLSKANFERTLFLVIFFLSAETLLAQNKNQENQNNRKDVIVIGAGFAGLSAARDLRQDGYDVVVLEARHRVGGRVLTSSAWSVPIDLGASWIHGSETNPLMSLVKKYKVKTIKTSDDSAIVYYSDGVKVGGWSKEEMDRQFQAFISYVHRKQSEEGVNDSLEKAVDQFKRIEHVKEKESRMLLYSISSSIEREYGVGVSQLSLLHFDQDKKLIGSNLMFLQGYSQIAQKLAEGMDIRYGEVVNAITYDNHGVKVATDKNIFEAECLVCTVPLGVLKEGKITFIPELPKEKVEAIHRMGVGLLNKIVLLFPQIFWESTTDWIGYIPEIKGHWVEFLNLYRATGQPILAAFNAGDFAKEIEQLSDEQIIDEVMKVLKTIYGQAIPRPIRHQITRWQEDPFSRGATSYIPVGGTGKEYAILAQPVMDRLFFAGEATTREHPNTVHGAYLSGIREAKRIQGLNIFKRSSFSSYNEMR